MNGIHIHRSGASRRAFLGTAGAALGAGLLSPSSVYAHRDDDDKQHGEDAQPNPIPGGVAPFAPFGVFIRHNPLNPLKPLAMINDPSQITDFDGVVGLTHIRGVGTGTNTLTHVSKPMSYQADMGFSKGKFIGTDGHRHEGTFAFV